MKNFQREPLIISVALLTTILLLTVLSGSLVNVSGQVTPPITPETGLIIDEYIEVKSESLSIIHRTYADGTKSDTYRFNGPSSPPEEYAEEIAATIFNGTINTGLRVPCYTWVFGCTATSAAMIAGYYDRTSFPNMYTGPTNNGVMPLYDSWPTWYDGYITYPNNPLAASHLGIDGRTTRGSIDDYWIKYRSTSPDPYITGGWSQHTWGSAIGDYMKTSQSNYGNNDGGAEWDANPDGTKSYCYPVGGIDPDDLTNGRQSFYEARGYRADVCYNQLTNNINGNGFSLDNFKGEIDAGHPVFLVFATEENGHAVVGIGYEGEDILLYDTWDTAVHSLPWGEEYGGYSLTGVSIVHPSLTQCYSLYLDTIGSGYLSTTTPNNCLLQYAEGTVIHLIANANAGWHFSHWLGGPTGGSTTDYVINADSTITAVFVQDSIVPTPTPQPTPIPSGWNQYFYSDNSLGTRCGSTRNETDIYMFRDSDAGWSPPSGCPGAESAWSVRMERNDANFQGGYYSFGLFYDDGARLYMDGNLIVDGWTATQHYESHYVSPGNHTLKLEYKNNAGHAIVQLWWQGPGALPGYDEVQDPNQWWANYWGNQTQWQDSVGRRNEGTGFLNHNWGGGNPGYGLPSDHFSTRFERTVGFECGTYRFHLISDDGSRLYIDGTLIPAFDHWSTNTWDTYADIPMTQANHVLIVDQFENGGGANVSFEWAKISDCPPSSPGAFGKTSPSFHEIDQGTSVLLTWQGTSPLTSYEYCYSNTLGCQNWTNVGRDTYVLISGLDYGATYFWQVRAINGTASPTLADDGLYWNFSTMSEPIMFRSFLPIIAGPIPIRNGNFEEGHVAWSEYSSSGYSIIENNSALAHSGSWVAWLGGGDNETSTLSQSISIPSHAPYMHYWYWDTSGDVCGYDFFRIKVNGTTIILKDLCASNVTGGWIEDVLDLSNYASNTVTLTFEVTTDISNVSSAFVDDIFFSGSLLTSQEFFMPMEFATPLIKQLH